MVVSEVTVETWLMSLECGILRFSLLLTSKRLDFASSKFEGITVASLLA